MFELVLTYKCDCSSEEVLLHKKALLSGKSYADVGAEYDDWYVTDTALIELAVELGWDLNEAMKAEWIEEQLNNCMNFDGERTESLRSGLCNEAYEFICERLEDITDPHEPYGHIIEQIKLKTHAETLDAESEN